MKWSNIITGFAILILTVIALGFVDNTNPVTHAVATPSINNIVADYQVALNVNDDTPDFIYDVGTRYNSITKEKLVNARSFDDFIGKKHAQRIVEYKSVSVIVLKENEEKDLKLSSDSGKFSAAQLELLKSANYSTNLLIWADYTEKNEETSEVETSTWTPYLTIVPETQAKYSNGKEALLDYLDQNSEVEIKGLTDDMLKPGKIFFTISKEGSVTNVKIVSTSGFPFVDEKIKYLITTSPGKWQSAKDSNGNNVDQTLVISFGKTGC